MDNEKNNFYYCNSKINNHYKIKKQKEMRNFDIDEKNNYDINVLIYKNPAVFKKLNNITKIINEKDIFDFSKKK